MPKMTVTFSLPNTPDSSKFFEAMRAWSDMVPTVYLLDNCCVSHIKDKDSTRAKSDPKHQKALAEMVNIDKPQNAISYMLTLLEKASDQGSKFSTDELVEEANRDVLALRGFFKNAQIYEPDYYIEEYIRGLKGVHPEVLGPEYHELLNWVNGRKLYNVVAEEKRLAEAKTIGAEADRLGIPKQHPVLLACIACIYDCVFAKKILKFKDNPEKFRSSNALGDILSVQRSHKLASLVEEDARGRPDGYPRALFLTDDEHLQEFYNSFAVLGVTDEPTADGVSEKYEMRINGGRLFPALFDANGELKAGKESELADLYLLFGVIARPGQ